MTLKTAKRTAFVVAFVYELLAYQVLIDRVTSVNRSSFFYGLGESGWFMPGYILGEFLGLVGGMGWAVIGQIVTFAVFYLMLEAGLSMFIQNTNNDNRN